MNSGVYAIINRVNNKFYIGGTCNFEKREYQHWWELKTNRHGNRHLQRAWNKYGKSSFRFEILEECAIEKVDAIEQKWIDKTNCCKIGYNISSCVEAPARGIKRSDETRKKMSESHKGRVRSEEHQANWTKAIIGKKASKETRKKMSEAKKGVKLSEEHKRASAKGRKHGPTPLKERRRRRLSQP